MTHCNVIVALSNHILIRINLEGGSTFIINCLHSSNSVLKLISNFAICNHMSTAGEIHKSALDSDSHYNYGDKRDLCWHCLEYKSFIVLFSNCAHSICVQTITIVMFCYFVSFSYLNCVFAFCYFVLMKVDPMELQHCYYCIICILLQLRICASYIHINMEQSI